MGTNTGIGIGIGIPFKNNALGGDRPYLPPELKARLIGVWDNYGKKNTDADRNIIKNKIPNAGGDLEILNSAYRLNSGFGGYSNDFQEYTYSENVVVKDNTNAIFNSRGKLLVPYSYLTKDIPSFKIKVSGLSNTYHFRYYYRDSNGVQHSVDMAKDGNYELPICYNVQSSSDGTDCGFANYGSDIVSVEILPKYEGAFVTDGVDDMIVSQNPVSEMLGGSNEITVVSMTHKLSLDNNWTNLIGELKGDHTFVANRGINTDKTGIYGYTYNYNENAIVINNILGDKNDYIVRTSTSLGLDNKYYVTGFRSAGIIQNISQIAWYWTFIANRVLTTDEINQVIAYFNLDRTLKPDILCDVKKQGITNENHAEFGDKLIDFSGNGRDIQLNNIAWDGDSGIGKYNYPNWKVNVTRGNKYARIVYYDSINGTYSADFKGITDLYKSYGLSVEIRVNRANTIDYHSIKEDGIYTVTPPDDTTSIDIRFGGENVYNASCDITITQIPSHAGALCLDGVNDFGKVTGMPIYKDYTIVVDYIRTFAKENVRNAPILSKSKKGDDGAFIFNYVKYSTSDTLAYDTLAYSFAGINNVSYINDFERNIYYQSKYTNNGNSINAGKGVDTDGMWLGTIRDNDYRFFNGAIYSLMTFPYSMSEFLIERQLKKHKLGTLYPDMVEFRPVIKHDDRITAIKYYHIKGSSWINLKPGDYIPVGSKISITTNLKSPYTIANVVSSSLTDIKVVPSAGDGNAYDILGYVTDKSPQKINLTIEQDEKYVLFNPIIKSNVEYHKLDFYLNNFEKRINIGDYIPKDAYLRANFYLKNNVDELTVFTFNGVNIDYRRSIVDDTAFNIGHIYNYDSPQEVNITIDEYIRYEDIKQPYPLLFEFTDENGNLISWGGKAKVGNTITRTKSVSNANILAGLYNTNNYKLNGKPLEGNSYVVEKQMVFTCTATWDFDNNEPKCILSPRLLRIPNSSYKILGHIPDISGHGNHGKINNSAYKLNSGVNGYLVDFTTLKDDGIKGIVRTDSKIYLDKSFNYNQGFWLGRTNNPSPAYKVKVSGIPETGMLTYTGGIWLNLVNGINELPARTNTEEEHGFVIQSPNLDWSNLVIEQIGEYEGAYCLDGVDDFVTIPTIVGGKQVLMKINWQNRTGLLYDQRKNGSSIDAFAILNVNSNNSIAYNSRNTDGETYIDGILNKNIVCPQLYKITHSITIINQLANKEEVISPTIGSDTTHKVYFSQMSLYDFMLFDDISTEDKIKELNEYVGIEAKVELPPYYWDAYGKTNLDADKATIQQRGVAVGDYDLTNTNFAYDKMSGFGGYTLGKFTNSWSLSNNSNSISIVSRNPYDITLKKLGENSDWEFNTAELKIISNPVSVKFKSDKNIRFTCDYHYYTVGGNSEGAPLGITSKDLIANEDTIITISPISQENIDKYNIDINRGYYLIYFQLSLTLVVNEEVTIEMLPLYPNGLVYDGVSDFTNNKNIPILTDFTFIIKREILGLETNDPILVIKGDKVYNNGIGNAFILEHNNNGVNYVYSYGKLNQIKRDDSKIIYLTPESYNGNPIIKGENGDNLGLILSRYWKGIIYKTILYSKTISLLEINFLKNLMERDEIIDLNNPIFIKNE